MHVDAVDATGALLAVPSTGPEHRRDLDLVQLRGVIDIPELHSARILSLDDPAQLVGFRVQAPPHAQTLAFTCLVGGCAVAVADVRDPTWVPAALRVLSAEAGGWVVVPAYRAWAVLSVEASSRILCLSSGWHAPASGGVRWNDPAIRIDWPLVPRPVDPSDVTHPPLSSRDPWIDPPGLRANPTMWSDASRAAEQDLASMAARERAHSDAAIIEQLGWHNARLSEWAWRNEEDLIQTRQQLERESARLLSVLLSRRYRAGGLLTEPIATLRRRLGR